MTDTTTQTQRGLDPPVMQAPKTVLYPPGLGFSGPSSPAPRQQATDAAWQQHQYELLVGSTAAATTLPVSTSASQQQNRQDSLTGTATTTTSNTATTTATLPDATAATAAATDATAAADLAAAHKILDELLAVSSTSTSPVVGEDLENLESLTLKLFPPNTATTTTANSTSLPTTAAAVGGGGGEGTMFVNPKDVMPWGKEPAPGAGLSQEEFEGLLHVRAQLERQQQQGEQQQEQQQILEPVMDAGMGMGMDLVRLAGNGSHNGGFGGGVQGDGGGGSDMPILDESSLFDTHGRFVGPGLTLTERAARLNVDGDVQEEGEEEQEMGSSGVANSWEETVGEFDESLGGFGG
ncbi:hypothetical protein BST61_g3953 [Cercospora zeina]